MNKPKGYDLESFTDILSVPSENLDELFTDIKEWHRVMKPLYETPTAGLVVDSSFRFTPDGQVNRSVTITGKVLTSTNSRELKVNRVEVIDSTGRAYIKGAIYGSPVKIKLDYQDDGRTLKIFVEEVEDE